MKVAEIMSSNVVTIGMDDSLATIKDIFENARFHHLMVVEEGELLGVISDRDLLRALSPNLGTLSEKDSDAATLKKRAHQIMTRKPVTLTSGASVRDAVDTFNNEGVSCVPIVDVGRKLVGVLSWKDVFRAVGSGKNVL